MNVIHEVAHRIQAETELERLNSELEKKYQELKLASEELSTITVITSKNIKEPIRQIYTTVEFLMKTEGRALSDRGKANLRRVQSSLNRMNLLLDDMLGVSQITTFQKPKSFADLDKILEGTLAERRERIIETGAKIAVEKLPSFNAFPEMLHSLFLHLLDNGLKFHKDGKVPQIDIFSKRVSAAEAQAQGFKNLNYWEISFKDDGLGFEQAEAAKIFMMFEKLNPANKLRGSGIGLAICRKIMNAHDGFIHAEGRPGEGSVFHCFFPSE